MVVNSSSNQVTARPVLNTNGINGKPALSFDGIDDNLVNSVNYLIPNTVFIVAHYNAASPRGRILTSLGNNWLIGWHMGDSGSFYAEGWVNNGSPADNSWQIFAGDHSLALLRLFKNNIFIASTSNGSNQGPRGLELGGQIYNQWSKAEVAEIIVYSRILTDFERQAVFLYLNARYSAY